MDGRMDWKNGWKNESKNGWKNEPKNESKNGSKKIVPTTSFKLGGEHTNNCQTECAHH